MIAHLVGTEPADERDPPGLVLGIELIEQRQEIFHNLVITQDTAVGVRKSYEIITEKFDITDSQLRQIEDAHAKMAAATTLEQWVAADLEFHSAILAATNNPLLRPLASMIATALESLLGLSALKAGDFKLALPEHGAVLAAIRAQDAPGAMQRMASLLADTRARLLKPAPKSTARKPAGEGSARRATAR